MKTKLQAREVKSWTWEDVDRAMSEFARVRAELELAQANLEHEINRVRAACEPLLGRLVDEAGEIEAALTKFGKAHRNDFKSREDGGETRSYEHAGVAIGYRLSPPAVRIEDEASAKRWLIQFADAFVRTRIELDREALGEALSDDSDPFVEKCAAHGITLQHFARWFMTNRWARIVD